MTNPETHQIEHEVLIPNLKGDAIGQRIKVTIPVTRCPHTGEEMLTEEAVEIIDTVKATAIAALRP